MRCQDGHENPDGQRFCGECGLELETSRVASMPELPPPPQPPQPPYLQPQQRKRLLNSSNVWVIVGAVILMVIVGRILTEEGSSSPAPDSGPGAISDGSELDSGSDTFTMPDLVGSGLQEAQDRLQSLGSYLLDQVDASGFGRIQILDSNWVVCEQSPPAGTEVYVDDFVTLSSVKIGESCP